MSSSTLEDFLCEKGTVLDFDAVCAIACDVISAIERLQDLGILHNNIATSNILIGQCPRVSKPICFFIFIVRSVAFPNFSPLWTRNLYFSLAIVTTPSLALCLMVTGRLMRLYDPQSCIGGSLVLLVSLTTPGR